MSGPVPFEEVKRFVSPDRVVELLGLPQARERRKVGCAWCASTDALHVYPDGFKCYSCGRSGDVIDVAAAVWRVDVADAARMLADTYGIQPDPLRLPRPAPRPPKRDAPDPEAARSRCEVYGDLPDLLTLSDRAREYLAGRGLDPVECADYGLRSIDGHKAFRALLSGLRQRHGLDAVQASGIDCKAWRLAFPLLLLPYWSATGQVVAVRARRLGSGRPKYLSPKGSPSPIAFNLEALEALHAPDMHPPRVIICEGELAALALHQAGEVAVGLPGATPSLAVLESLAESLAKASKVVIWPDPDEPGAGAVPRVVAALTARHGATWVRERVRRWNPDCDPDEWSAESAS